MYGIFTCNHVVGSELEAKNAEVIFDFEGANPGQSSVILRPDDTFRTHKVSFACSNLFVIFFMLCSDSCLCVTTFLLPCSDG